jgi:hypothetical protein
MIDAFHINEKGRQKSGVLFLVSEDTYSKIVCVIIMIRIYIMLIL